MSTEGLWKASPALVEGFQYEYQYHGAGRLKRPSSSPVSAAQDAQIFQYASTSGTLLKAYKLTAPPDRGLVFVTKLKVAG